MIIKSRRICVLITFALVLVAASCVMAPEDEIADKKTYLEVQAKCKATAATGGLGVCVKKEFDLKTNLYCAQKELSPGHQKCVEIHEKVKAKILKYIADDVLDAFDTYQNRTNR